MAQRPEAGRRDPAHRQRLNIGDATVIFWAEADDPQEAEAAEWTFAAFTSDRDTDEQATRKLRDALEVVAKGRPLVNSVTGEEEKLEAILPLVKKYNVPVVAISNDDTGISMDPDVRFAVAKKIVERAP